MDSKTKAEGSAQPSAICHLPSAFDFHLHQGEITMTATQPKTDQTSQTLQKRFDKLRDELNAKFLERENMIDGVLACLLSKQML